MTFCSLAKHSHTQASAAFSFRLSFPTPQRILRKVFFCSCLELGKPLGVFQPTCRRLAWSRLGAAACSPAEAEVTAAGRAAALARSSELCCALLFLASPASGSDAEFNLSIQGWSKAHRNSAWAANAIVWEQPRSAWGKRTNSTNPCAELGRSVQHSLALKPHFSK